MWPIPSTASSGSVSVFSHSHALQVQAGVLIDLKSCASGVLTTSKFVSFVARPERLPANTRAPALKAAWIIEHPKVVGRHPIQFTADTHGAELHSVRSLTIKERSFHE